MRPVAVEAQTDARRAALEGLFDHAALFPPASLAMDAALAEDRRLRTGPEAWVVRRFVCPLSRLGELGAEDLPLSVVLDAEPDGLLDDPRVQAVEVPPGRGAAKPPDDRRLDVYVERPLDDLAWLGELPPGACAKARCGGSVVPSVEQLAAFVRRCRELSLPFKATAGLHHPVRGEREHGFLNLLAAAAFGDEEKALAERDASAFRLDGESFAWRDREARAVDVARVRRELLASIGSCSVAEPVGELRALGILDG